MFVEGTPNDDLRLAFKKPVRQDLASPLAYLKYLDGVFRAYVRGEVAWQDVRDTLKASTEIIARFEAEANASPPVETQGTGQ